MLDLGCGAGQDARALKRARYEVIGLDFTRPLLQYARRQSPRLRLVQADVPISSIESRSFQHRVGRRLTHPSFQILSARESTRALPFGNTGRGHCCNFYSWPAVRDISG